MLGAALSGRGGFAVCPGAPGCAPAVCVAEHAGEMLDGVGVVVCSVVGGIGGVLWYPVRGLMGLGYEGYVLEVCVVSAEVRDLEGW